MIERSGETPARRAELVQRRRARSRAGLPVEPARESRRLPREQAPPLLDAYHEGALALGEPFGVWGAIALDRADPAGRRSRARRGCVGISLPAGAIAERRRARARCDRVLRRLEHAGAPLFVHPGPGLGDVARRARRRRAVAGRAAVVVGADALRRGHARRVAGVRQRRAPRASAAARRSSRCSPGSLRCTPSGCARAAGPPRCGRPADLLRDLLLRSRRRSPRRRRSVGSEQLLYGSDRPVADPAEHGVLDALDWDAVDDATRRALRRGGAALADAPQRRRTWRIEHARPERGGAMSAAARARRARPQLRRRRARRRCRARAGAT